MRKFLFTMFLPAILYSYTLGYELEARFLPPDGGYASTPAIGDVDHDGVPEIVFGTGVGHIYICSKDVRNVVTIENEISLGNMVYAPSIGDLDDDGVVEIVAYVWDGVGKVVAVHPDGSIVWETPIFLRYGYDYWDNHNPSLGDLNGDDIADVVLVIGAISTPFYIVALDGVTGTELWRYNLGVAVAHELCAIIDLDMDSNNEVIASFAAPLTAQKFVVLRNDGSYWWEASGVADFGVADFDGDSYPEIAAAGNTVVRLYTYDGTLISASPAGDASGMSGPTIADFDRDGLPELAVGTFSSRVLAFDFDTLTSALSLMWDSGDLGVGEWDNPDLTSADFDCDGVPDIITISDDQALVIIDGETGAILEPATINIDENEHTPALADVDGDGYGEVIVTSGIYAATYNREVLIFGNDGVWGYARTYWNQMSFWQTNLDENLSVSGGDYTPWLIPRTNMWRSLYCFPPGINLIFSEETDCNDSNIVEICYNLGGYSADVTIELSPDLGRTWTEPGSSWFSTIWDTAGDFGEDVATGEHCFYWLLSTDVPDSESCNWTIRAIAVTIDGADTSLYTDCLDSRPPDVMLVCPKGICAGESYTFEWSVDDLFRRNDPCSLHFFGCRISEYYQVDDTFFNWISIVGCESCTLIAASRDSFCNWGYDICVFAVSNLTVNAGNDTLLCGLGEYIELGGDPTAGDGIPPYTYLWSSEPPGFHSVQPNPLTPLSETTLFMVFVTDSLGCNMVDSILVTVSDITIDAGNDTTICHDDPITLGGSPTASGGIGRYSYEWYSVPPGFISYEPNPVTSPETTNTYFLILYDETPCSIADSIIVTVADNPRSTIINPNPCGGITSCEYQGFEVQITDSYADIDEYSIHVTVNGVLYTSVSPELTWTFPDTLEFTPSTPWYHGEVVVFTLDYAANIHGCAANTVTCTVTVDIEPPIVVNPSPGHLDTIINPTPVISIDITDDIAGIDSAASFDLSNITVTINGVEVTGFTITWNSLNLEIFGLCFVDGDSVEVCLDSLVDEPTYDYCPPNDTFFCWTFWVVISFPYSWLIEPLDLNGDSVVASACSCQPIIIGINDVDGIDPNTIALIVEGVTYSYPDPHLAYSGSILTFTPGDPPPCWEDSQVVNFSLVQADDIYGFNLTDTLTDSFLVDLSPPVFFNEYPPNGSTLSELLVNISVSVIDSVLGSTNLDSIQLFITINGGTPFHHPALEYDNLALSTGDSVGVCALDAHDNPDYCEPNFGEFCWWFRVMPCDMSVIVTATDSTVCAGDSILLIPVVSGGLPPFSYLWDTSGLVSDDEAENPYGYNPAAFNRVGFEVTVTDSLDCVVRGSLLVAFSHIIADAGPDYEICPHDTVGLGGIEGSAYYGIPPYEFTWTNDVNPGWVSNVEYPRVTPDVTTIYYIEARDSIGCYAYDTVVVINEFEPVGAIEPIAPPHMGLLPPGDIEIIWESATGTPPIYYTLYIDDTLVVALIESTHYTVNYPCGETHSWNVQAINVCDVSIWDPLFCATLYYEMYLDTCINMARWWWGPIIMPIWDLIDSCCYNHPPVYPGTLNVGFDPVFTTYPCDGPIATIIHPLPNTYSACDPESIIIVIEDTDGVGESTIELIVNGLSYTTTSAELRWSDPYLIFKPLTGWSDGGTINVSLVSADDTYGNPLQGAPIEWSFTIDYSAPRVHDILPPCGDTLYSDGFIISFYVFDDLSGLNPDELYITFLGDEYDVYATCVTWDGDSGFTFDPLCVGYTFTDGDIVTYCIHSEDTPDYCNPNERDTCCSQSISMECSLQGTAGPDMWICPGTEVELGCDPTAWSGVPPYIYSWSPPTYLDCSTCPNPGASPLTTTTYILTVTDSSSCMIVDTVVVHADYESPGPFSSISPHPGATVPPGDIVLQWEEAPGASPMYYDLYIDSALVATMMDSTQYTVNYPCGHEHYWLVVAYNYCRYSINLCSDDDDSIIFDYLVIDTSVMLMDPPFSTWACEGPVASIIRPVPNTFSACDPESIVIQLVSTDTLINESTIELSVNSVIYHTTDPVLEYRDEEFLVFHPDPMWENGDTVRVILLHAIDYHGEDLAEPLTWRFTMDTSPPRVWDFNPPCGSTINVDEFTVTLKVFDSLSGLNEDRLFLISLAGDSFTSGDDCFTWDGDSMITFDTNCAGYEFVHGSVFSFCIHTEDMPDYCDANIRDTCCNYSISMECSLQASAGPDQYICPENSVVLGCNPTTWSGVPPYTFSWTPTTNLDNPTSANPMASPSVTTMYILEARDSADCVIFDTVTVYVEYEVPGPFGLIYPVNVTDILPGDIILEWEASHGTQPVFYNLYIDDVLVDSWLDSTYYTVYYPCGHTHSWEVRAFNLCLNSIHFCEYGAWDTIMYFDTIYYDPISDTTPEDPLFSTYPCSGPIGVIINPDPNTYTACEPDTIIIELVDTSEIIESTILLKVQDFEYTTIDPQMTWLAPLIRFVPDPMWQDGELVHVRLLEAENRVRGTLQNAPVEWWFSVDLSPPVADIFEPTATIVSEIQPAIIIHLTDLYSGVDINSVVLSVDEIDYYIPAFDWNPATENITYLPPEPFTPGDTVYIILYACDQPDYCDPNCDSSTWYIRIEPYVSCMVHPNPFTPNNDGYNEIVIFDYPNMFSVKATVSIFNIRNVKVWEKSMSPVSEFTDFIERSWNGMDNQGKNLPEGIYIYTVEVDRKVVCNGTIILAR